MFHSHDITLKPSLVLIASNEGRENDNENLAHVVDNISSETNKELMSHNDERSVTGENNDDGIPVPENQRVIDNSALTILRTESRCVISPAGFARTGFANTGFLPYPAHSYRDNQQKATRSDLHHPVAQQAFEQPSLSQYQHEPVSDSVATNGVAEHSPGTKVETVDASSQTEIERVSDHSCEGKCYIKYMDNNNKFILKLFNCFFSTMAVMANGGILNSTSPSFAGTSSTNLPLENVYQEDNAHPEETQVSSSTDENSLEAAPRNISFSRISVSMETNDDDPDNPDISEDP